MFCLTIYISRRLYVLVVKLSKIIHYFQSYMKVYVLVQGIIHILKSSHH